MLELAAVTLGAFQLAVVIGERRARDMGFITARAAADAAGKPLLVVGGPYGTSRVRRLLQSPAHGHGDVCMDISPLACGEGHFVLGDVRDIPFPDGMFGASFCSHVLEHLPTVEACSRAVLELQRVADEVVVLVPSRWDLIAWAAPEHRLWVQVTDDGISARPMRPMRVLR